MLLLLSEIPYMVLCVPFNLLAKLWLVRQKLINLEENRRVIIPESFQLYYHKPTNYTITKC